MKYENQRKILNIVNEKPISRIELAGKTGLTQASVSIIVEDLIADGILYDTEISSDKAALGRKPTLLEINSNWKYVIGISIDRDGIDIGICNLKGQVVDRCPRFAAESDYAACLDVIAQKVSELTNRNPDIASKIIAAGVAVPGPVDSENGKLLNPPGFFLSWHNLDLYRELAKRVSYPVYMEHNSLAFAKAEKSMGIGKQYDSFVLLNVSAGFGAGLVLNRQVYSGKNGFGGETGHTSIDINGRLCACGNRGCIELYASTSAILYEINHAGRRLRSWKELVDLAYDQDDLCRRYIALEADYLGHVIINMNNMLGLDAAILTGEIAYRPELLLQKIKEKINGTITNPYRAVAVHISPIQNDARIVAGSAIVIDRIFCEQGYLLRFRETQQE
ncbi:MAG: ROK family transcriptional regulator [Clostridiales bacterium]|nr:ROK family transcriptional regulator [Clostridiales bacterium]